MKIGIFDSGKGGFYVAEQLTAAFPDAIFTVVDDSKNVPYGNKPEAVIYTLAEQALQPLLHTRHDIIVIACNTVTAVAIEKLRHNHPDQQFIGYEPMIKPASLASKTKVIAILATPATLKSTRYQKLKSQWTNGIRVIEPDCSSWSTQIEAGQPPYEAAVKTALAAVNDGADYIVLACTHYLVLKDTLRATLPDTVTITEPTPAVIRHISISLYAEPTGVPQPQ